MSALRKIQESALYQRYQLSGKVFIIGFLALVLMIPGVMVKNMMEERQKRSDEAKQSIHRMWSDEQTLIGPVLEVPYWAVKKGHRGEVKQSQEYFYVLPEQLDVQSELVPEVRRRGIFETVLYVAHLNLNGTFMIEDLLPKGAQESDVDWEDAKILMSVSDARGVKSAHLKGAEENTFKTYNRASRRHGLGQVMMSPYSVKGLKEKDFTITMQLKGSESFRMVPVGESTNVTMQSHWHSPSFLGDFLPDSREISEESFQAEWSVSGLSRGLPQSWANESVDLDDAEFGVRLMMPLGAYSRSLRVVSYALLFVTFTFGAMFCAERMSGVTIHILQYLVAGVAMMVFYVLLLSLAEQVAFALAYATAAGVIVLMLVGYVNAILKRKKLTSALGAMLVLMYGFFYVVLQCEDYALLVGSAGLVIIVGAVMYFTRDLHHMNKDE
jgi:inner membrane protein